MADKSIQQGLEQDARRVEERIPIDMAKKKMDKIATSLRAFMRERRLSQASVAKSIGVSTSQLSQFLSGKYKGNLEELVNKVVNLINSVTRKENRVRNKPFIETSVAKRIGTLITQTEAFSEDEGKIGLIVGDGGHGKSHCLREYAQANKNTIYVELDGAMSPTMLFAEIAKKIGVDPSGSLSAVTRGVIDGLANRHIIVMLDEASDLTVKQLNQLRQIIVVKARCPLILAGNRHLRGTVMRPTVKRGSESLDQFTSRLMGILDLDAVASERDGGLYTIDDIRKLYQYGGIKLTGDAISTLRKICKSPRSGRLRTCSHIITALHLSPVVVKAGQIDAEFVVAVIEQLDLPVKVHLPVRTRGEGLDEEQGVQPMAVAG